jgi:hypothetical protein
VLLAIQALKEPLEIRVLLVSLAIQVLKELKELKV